jgi:hypothetical protein
LREIFDRIAGTPTPTFGERVRSSVVHAPSTRDHFWIAAVAAAVIAVLFVGILLVARPNSRSVPANPHVASSVRTDSSPGTPALPPDPLRLTGQNCSAAPSTTKARALGAYYTLGLAPSWIDTGDYVHTESLLLQLTAPASYGYGPTRINFHAFPYDVPKDFGSKATARSISEDDSVTHQHITLPRLIATLVADCVVAAEPAAAFGYSEGNYRGYWLLIVHHERLLGVHLFGAGGVSDQALQDALGMIGSITWTF